DPCVGDELFNGTERLARSSSLLAMPSAPPTPSPFGCCHVPYRATVQQRLRLVQELPLKDQIFDYLLQVLQGTGLLEYSPIFYGFYTKETIYVPWGDTTKSYELPLAYLSAMLFLMAFCLVVMVRKAAQGLRENLRSTEGEFYQVCNLIFGGWDFCVDNNKAARVKHRAIYNEFCRHLDAERFREEKEMRSRKERSFPYIHLLINVLVLGIIVGAFVMVWYVTTFSFGQLRLAQASVTAGNNASYASALTSSNSSREFLDSYSEVTFGINNSHATGPIFVGSEHVTFTPEAASNAADTTWRSVMTSQDVVSAEYDTAFDADDVVYDTQTPIDAVGVVIVPDTSNAVLVESQVEFVPDSSNAVPVESQIEFVPDTSSAVQDESDQLRVASTSGAAQVLRSTPVARLVTASSSSFTPLLTNAKTTSAFSVDEGLEKVSEEPASGDDLHPLLMLVYRYLPSATIIALNIFVPLLFNQLVLLERYSTTVVLRLTLMRTVVLRLASLGVLLYALRSFTLRSYTVDCPTPSLHNCASANCKGQVLCWETYVGQELYKLTLLDLAVTAFNTFFVNLLRKVVGQHLLKRTSFGQRVGAMEFEIPKHVLDIVYGQTLCWLGMFYAPLLPLITAFKLVLVFYIKYFDCSFNSRQSSQFYRTSRSNALFISILLISFIVTIIPVGYSIVDLTPSLGCGPFRGLDAIWTQMVNLISALPEWIQSVVFFLGTAGFAVPTIVLLSLAGYYYYAVASANQHLVLMLKGQLVLEGHDKQFLLNRLDLLIKRVNEDDDRRRRHHRRNSDVSPGASNDITLQIGASR
ncbi:transmembrane channel-like protein 7, partial [Hyalella azteca]|uniref:Transmembrane channel-like protein 7 n=1 Tax=Hyalella azteca TaxID=294128 RepID=A0A8B7NLX1_HYAAZ